MLKKVPREDVFARDKQLNIHPLSSVGIHVDFAEKFGLLFKDKNNQYQLGPNLDFVYPQPLIRHPLHLSTAMISINGQESIL